MHPNGRCSSCRYFGSDYPETAEWYQTGPDIHGDAQTLPIRSGSVDGVLICNVPFLYPIHDAPHDCGRWAKYGLVTLATGPGFVLEEESYSGEPIESSALLRNVALTKTVLNWISERHIASVLVLLFSLYVLINNIIGWVLSLIAAPDDVMPTNYQMVCRKK